MCFKPKNGRAIHIYQTGVETVGGQGGEEKGRRGMGGGGEWGGT
jgi:hypothetical protein